ncbi:MAG: hypothetical protein WC047_05115 [Kiritimatiellales bacterium]
MNKTKISSDASPEQGRRAIDDSQVRAMAALVEIDLDAFNFYAGDLRAKLETLHKELEFADPVKDRLFEKFMYKLQRFIMPLDALGELKQLAKAMEEYGLPSAAEVAEIIRHQKDAREIKIVIPHVEKHLTKEPVHA